MNATTSRENSGGVMISSNNTQDIHAIDIFNGIKFLTKLNLCLEEPNSGMWLLLMLVDPVTNIFKVLVPITSFFLSFTSRVNGHT